MASLIWHRVLTAAVLVIALMFLAIMAVAGVLIPPLLVFALVFFALAAALQRWGSSRWLLLLTTALSGLALVGNLPGVVADLAHPETFSTFAPTFIAVIASIVGVVAGVASAFDLAPGVARLVGLAAVALVVVALVGSVAATAMAGDVARVEGDIDVVAENVDYPEHLDAKAGQIAFFIENHDRFRHTFVIVDQGASQELPAARSRRLEVTLPAGSYKYICDVLGHDGMEGTLEVK